MRKWIIFIFFGILLLNLVSAEMLVSGTGVEYDSDLFLIFEDSSYATSLLSQPDFIGLKIINNTIWANILVEIKDNSGIIYSGTKEERVEQSKKRNDWFAPIVQDVLINIPETEIININKGYTGFSALVTKEGFERLISDSRIDNIIWAQYAPKPFLEEGVPLTGANSVWNYGYTGKETDICIIDSGVNSSNLYIYNNVAGEHCYCSDNCCPDGTPEDNNAEDVSGEHGTIMISTIVSNAEHSTGIAYNSSIYIVRIANNNGEFSSDWQDYKNAVDWCTNQGADIISMSFGIGYYNSQNCVNYFDTQLNNAYAIGILLI